MNFKYFSLPITAFLFLSFGITKELNTKIDKEIKKVYNIEEYSCKVVSISIELAKELPSKFHENNLLEIKSKDTLKGYIYMSKALSKTAEFDYLVLLDKDLIVLKAKVLAYREDYGGEVGSKRWLKQFIGKTQNDDLKLGDNIVAISGATISVRSMTNAMNDLLRSLKILHLKNIL